MKIVFIYVAGGKEPFAELAESVYQKKISRFIPFEIIQIKAKSAGRDDAQFKKKAESDKIIEMLKVDDFVVLFDESGHKFNSSLEFSQAVVKAVESGKKRVVFIIGGAFGFTEEVRSRSQQSYSMSRLTLNHHVAKVVALEQIYRAFTIWKSIPYHND